MAGKNRYKASSRIKKRSDTKKTLKNLVRVVILIAVIAGPIFALRAKFLQIGKVEVLGAETIQVADIEGESKKFFEGTKFLFIPKSNILLLNEDKMAAALLNEFPSIQNVEINKKINNDL